MNIQEKIDLELKTLKEFFISMNEPFFTAAITGSIARGDMCIRNGELVSDIDVLIFLQDKSYIEGFKSKIKFYEKKYNFRIAFIFTRVDVLNSQEKRARGYLKNICEKHLLYDGLNIKEKINPIKSVDEEINLKSSLQELGYYLSKYNAYKVERDIQKVKKIWGDIGSTSTPETPNLREIEKIIQLHNILILNSTKVFLQEIFNTNPVELYLKIREEIFLENQGFSFEESYYEL